MENKRNLKPVIICSLLLLLLLGGLLYALGHRIIGRINPITIEEYQDNNLDVPFYDEDNELFFSFSPAENAAGDVTYELISAKDQDYKDVDYFSLLSATDTQIIAKKATPAGIYTLTLKAHASGADGYIEGSKTFNYIITINKLDSVFENKPEAIEGLIYNGKDQELITAGICETGKVEYRLEDGEWLEKIPTGLDAGLYTVYYRVTGDENHNDIKEDTIVVEIARKATTGFKPSAYSGISIPSLSSLLDYIKNNSKSGYIYPHIPVSGKPATYVEYVYDGNVHTNGYVAPKGIEMVGLDHGTHAGTYIAIYKPGINYCWSDGSTTSVTVTLRITKKKLPLPYVVSDLEYNGQIQKVEIANVDEQLMSVIGDQGRKTGDYVAVVTLKNVLDYEWENKSILPISLNWKIVGKKIPVPSVTTSYTYKTTILGIPVMQIVTESDFDSFDPDTMRIVGGNCKINAGNYFVEIALKDKNNTQWADEEGGNANRFVPWSINRKSVGDKPEDVSYTYDGRRKSNGYNVPIGVSYSGDSYGRDAGEYKAIYTPKDNYCWSDGTYDPVEVVLTIEKADSTYKVVPKAKSGLVYTGSYQELVSKGSSSDGTIMYKVDSTGQTGNYTEFVPTGKNADTFKVSYYIAGDKNHNDSEVSEVEVVIAKADPKIDAYPKALSLVYNGEDQQLIKAGSSEHGTFFYRLENEEYSEVIPSGKESGEYVVYYRFAGDKNHNDIAETELISHISQSGDAKYKVEPEPLTSAYDGTEHPLLSAGSSDDGTVLYRLKDEEWSENIPCASEIGTYDVYYMIKGDDNHADSKESHVKATIRKADLIINAEDQTFDYNGEKQGNPIEVITADGLKATVMYKTSYLGRYSEEVPQFTDVNTDITGKVDARTIYYKVEAYGHDTVEGSYKLTINRIDPEFDGEITGLELSYNGSKQNLINEVGVTGGEITYSVNGGRFRNTVPSAKNVGEYKVSYKVDGDNNHNDIDAVELTSRINEAEILYSGDDLIISFDGKDHGRIVTAKTVDGSKATVLYGETEGTYDMAKAPLVYDVGEYVYYYQITAKNHKSVTGSYKITVNKGKGDLTAPVANENLVYIPDTMQDLLKTGASSTSGEVLYSLDGSSYSAELPQAMNAGTYSVYYKSVGDANHEDVECEAPLSITIAKADASLMIHMDDFEIVGEGILSGTVNTESDGVISCTQTENLACAISGDSITISVIKQVTAQENQTITVSVSGGNYTDDSVNIDVTLVPSDYTVMWMDKDGNLISSSQYSYGALPQSPEGYDSWDKDVKPVTGNIIYNATDSSEVTEQPENTPAVQNEVINEEVVENTVEPVENEVVIPEHNESVVSEMGIGGNITDVKIASQKDSFGNDVNYFYLDNGQVRQGYNVPAGTYSIDARVTITWVVEENKQTGAVEIKPIISDIIPEPVVENNVPSEPVSQEEAVASEPVAEQPEPVQSEGVPQVQEEVPAPEEAIEVITEHLETEDPNLIIFNEEKEEPEVTEGPGE